MVMADAVQAVQNTRKHFDATVEQIPIPASPHDLDRNHRPDGYSRCSYAPAEITLAARWPGCRVWAARRPGSTGRRPATTTLKLTVRSADDVRRTLTPVLTRAEINSRYEYRWIEKERCGSVAAGTEWQTAELPLRIGTDVDRVKIEFEINPPGKMHVRDLSWRLAQPGSR